MANRLLDYLDSIRARDPALHSRWEILTYPGVWALAWHRLAHRLYRSRAFLLARIVNHWSRATTAIDIHPGATIGRNFFIDHGFVVIGETAHIGDNVTIYQCVTLGGTSPDNGVAGKRHPTIADGAIIGSGAQVLGPITVGPGSRIGANAVVTRDVPAGAVMVGIPARATMVAGGQAPEPRFVPYGTPCSEMFDPQTQKVELLRCELETMRKRLDALLAEGDAEQAPRLMGSVTPFPLAAGRPSQIGFDRAELTRILDLYGRMVSAGHWRDYAIELGRDAAVFAAFRRAAERPEYRIEKRPALRGKQGMWALVSEAGGVLKRGHELAPVLAPVERRLLRLVED